MDFIYYTNKLLHAAGYIQKYPAGAAYMALIVAMLVLLWLMEKEAGRPIETVREAMENL